jgi:hypothetical protein
MAQVRRLSEAVSMAGHGPINEPDHAPIGRSGLDSPWRRERTMARLSRTVPSPQSFQGFIA